MTFVNESLDEMLRKIRCKRVERDEVLVPSENSLIFYPSIHDSKMIMIANHYIWGLGEFARRKYDPIFELYSNALNRGNNGDWDLPFRTIVFGGTNSSRGTVLRIEDCGDGFDYRDIISNFEKGKIICKNKGNGIEQCYGHTEIYISYEGKGNIVNVRSPIRIQRIS
jgi:hypothetical protein